MEQPIINISYMPPMQQQFSAQSPQIKKIQNYVFNMNQVLGKGNFSKVYKALNEVTTSENFKDINIGSPIYMAPEGLIDNVYGPKTDIWGFGVFLYQVLHGDTPLGFCKTQAELQFHIMKPFTADRIKYHISPDLKDLICRCLEIDERKRISAKEIELHPYMMRIYRELGKDSEVYSIGGAFSWNSNKIVTSVPYAKLDEIPSPLLELNRGSSQPQQPESRLPAFMRGASLQVPGEQFQIRGLSPMEVRKNSDNDRPNRAGSHENPQHVNIVQMNPYNNAQQQQAKPIDRSGSPTRPKTQSKIITNFVTFQECVHLLHYCRLLYKTITQMQKQQRLATTKVAQIYVNWLLDFLDQIDSKIPFYVKFEGQKAALREKKLKEVVTEYYTKYNKQLARKQGVEGSLQHVQSMSVKFLHYLDTHTTPQSRNYETNMLANYVCFLVQVNKLLEKCIAGKDFTELIKGCNIQSFLGMKKENFDQNSYMAVKAKLETLMVGV